MKTILTILMLIAPLARAADIRDELTGQWLGTSICTEPRGACHDEIASYRFSKHKDPDKVTVSANKIVNGEEQVMGIDVFTVDAKARTVQADIESRRGPFRVKLAWKGKEMTGTFVSLSDGRVLRNIAIKRK